MGGISSPPPCPLDPPTPVSSVLNEKTSVSWPVLIILVSCALYVGASLNVLSSLSARQSVIESDVTMLRLARESDRGEVNMIKYNIADLSKQRTLSLTSNRCE